jgi:hypothetical protein
VGWIHRLRKCVCKTFDKHRLTFETRPVNPPEKFGGQPAEEAHKVSSPAKVSQHTISSEPAVKSWMDEIDERIRLKAGNVLTEPKPSASIQQPADMKPQQNTEPKPSNPSESKFGTGISEAEIDKIMTQFEKR